MTARRAASAGILAIALAGCKPGPAGAAPRGDAGPDAHAATDGGGSAEGGAASSASGDAATTDDGALPAGASDELNLRAQHLFEAIMRDNPDLASDILFPRDAFVSARDTTDPGKVWDTRLSAAFRRAVHSFHKRTKGIERAQFISFEIGRTVTQAPIRHHDWKVPLWRVPHARLTYLLDGRTSRIDVGELTSWRGAWYVTKLR